MGQEMVRLLKIFGLTSLGLVLLLSLFNERRANNSGVDPTFRISDPGMLFFKNIRRIDYAVKHLPEANIDIYTHKGFGSDSSKNTLILELIVHKNKNSASLYLVHQGQPNDQQALQLQIVDNGKVSDTLQLRQGNRYVHLKNSETLIKWLNREKVAIETKVDEKWIPIIASPKEKEAFINTYQDFLKITSTQ